MTAPLFYKECQFFPHSKYYPYLCLKIIDIYLWYYLSILNYYLYRKYCYDKKIYAARCSNGSEHRCICAVSGG